MTTAIFTILSYISGSIMYSHILVKYMAKKDISKFGDGNPGAANAFRAGGPVIGILALIGDFFKGFIPVAIAKYCLNLGNTSLFFISAAAIIGHAFSFILKFKGGKSIAVSYGVWTALTIWQIPILWGIYTLIGLAVIKKDHLSVVLAMLFIFVSILIFDGRAYLVTLSLVNMLILCYKGKHDIFPNAG